MTPRSALPRPLHLGLLALGAAGVAALAAAQGGGAGAALGRLGAPLVLGLLGLSAVNYALRALRWHLLVRRLGARISARRNILHFLAGFALCVTPGRVGEAVRLRWLRRDAGIPFARSAPLMLMDRAADLAAMALLLAAALVLSGGAGGAALGAPVAAGALALAVGLTRPRLLHGIAGVLWRLGGRRAPRLAARLRRAARALARLDHGPTVAAALAAGLCGWLAEGLALHLLLGAMGAPLPAAAALAVFLLATLAGGLTGAPGGLGGAEAAMVLLLRAQGVPLEVALPATAVIRLTTLWFAIGLGVLLLPLAERGR